MIVKGFGPFVVFFDGQDSCRGYRRSRVHLVLARFCEVWERQRSGWCGARQRHTPTFRTCHVITLGQNAGPLRGWASVWPNDSIAVADAEEIGWNWGAEGRFW